MPQNKLPFLILHVSKRSKGRRPISVIGNYPMYRSTGKNSSHAGTFFPFSGISPSPYDLGWFQKPVDLGWFQKPGYGRQAMPFAPKFYPPSFVKDCRLKQMSRQEKDILMRFGNFEAMCTSYLIGGGYWETDTIIGPYLQTHFKDYLDAINKKCQMQISELQRHIKNSTFTNVFEIVGNHREKDLESIDAINSQISQALPGVFAQQREPVAMFFAEKDFYALRFHIDASNDKLMAYITSLKKCGHQSPSIGSKPSNNSTTNSNARKMNYIFQIILTESKNLSTNAKQPSMNMLQNSAKGGR